MKTVIMAGGKGTRISSLNSDVPKPMISICGKPILQWQIECLAKQGFKDIIVSVGYKGEIIKQYFTDGSGFGVKIRYLTESSPLGTAGALYYLKGIIDSDFLLINGDIVFDIDFNRFIAHHNTNKGKGALSTILTHPNDHPFDSGIIVVDSMGCVKKWMHKEDSRTWYKNRVNAGLHILSPSILDMIQEPKKLDLDRDVLTPLINDKKLFAYDSPEYVKDMGTPERYYRVENDINNGVVEAKNLINKQKAVFFDRDGTLNKHVGFLKNIDDFELLPGASKMIKKTNEANYLAIVVTNQPVIARGEVSWEELEMIHNKMETLLGAQGAYLDDIFVCPHHPDSGYLGERKEYKIVCNCRKPKPGMILNAATKYNIDLSKSFMVGDSENDRIAAETAGCHYYDVKDAQEMFMLNNGE